MKAYFAVPGDLSTPTGGYAYARRVMAEINAFGVDLIPCALPDGFPHASDMTIERAIDSLTGLRTRDPIFLDGLAGGVLPGDRLAALGARVVMLCHHPLALETGLSPRDAARLRSSERVALATCSHVVATSETTAQILTADYDVPQEKLTVARPGTDPAPTSGGSGGTKLRILSVGSLTPRKGHDRLIAALSDLAQTDPHWHLRIVGAPLDADHAAGLANQIETHGLAGRITLVGALNAEELAGEYARADLFVLASHYEGFGMAFAEAVARGLPVLGLACDAVAEATLGAARLTTSGDFAGELGALIRDDARRAALAALSAETAPRLQRWSETARVIADILHEVH